MVAKTCCVPDGAVSVLTVKPPVPVMFNVTPLVIKVVWKLFVLPYCSEAMVPPKAASTVLLMLETPGMPPMS